MSSIIMAESLELSDERIEEKSSHVLDPQRGRRR